mmetsp:Transcript_46257/g.112106  ORF Transcript_46257/g.112106 Transcript_46257/m.112106 type:complete len:81 (+) Transcript_46257:179-421(+)
MPTSNSSTNSETWARLKMPASSKSRKKTGHTRESHGRGLMMRFDGGKVIMGDWVHGVVHGQATVFYPDGGSYFGTYIHTI